MTYARAQAHHRQLNHSLWGQSAGTGTAVSSPGGNNVQPLLRSADGMERVGGGGANKKKRHGGTTALIEPVASDSAVAGDIAVFEFSVFEA